MNCRRASRPRRQGSCSYLNYYPATRDVDVGVHKGASMELEGKVAAITGGTRGIGRAIAEAFLREGAKVVINGRNEEKGQRALAEMKGGDDVIFVAGDVKVREDCERIIDTAIDTFGRLDIMVNNAGGGDNHANV